MQNMTRRRTQTRVQWFGKRFSPFFALLTFLACQYDPHAHLYTTQEPQPADLPGHYALVTQTLTRAGLAALHGKPCDIELRADGTFTARNIPPWQSGPPGENFFSTLVSGSGRWRVDSVGAIDDGSRQLKTHWGIYLDSPAGKMEPVGLTGQKPPYGLIFTLGDPDSGDALIFEKTK